MPNVPTGPQAHVLRLMRRRGKPLVVNSSGWGEVGGVAVSGLTVEGLDNRGLIQSSDGGTTYLLSPEGVKWATKTTGDQQ